MFGYDTSDHNEMRMFQLFIHFISAFSSPNLTVLLFCTSCNQIYPPAWKAICSRKLQFVEGWVRQYSAKERRTLQSSFHIATKFLNLYGNIRGSFSRNLLAVECWVLNWTATCRSDKVGSLLSFSLISYLTRFLICGHPISPLLVDASPLSDNHRTFYRYLTDLLGSYYIS